MARTKADASKKAGGKAPRKAPVLRNTPSSSGGITKRKSRSSAGSRNAVCKRPVPKWQVSVKDLAWMKPGSSKDQEAQVIDFIDLEPEHSPASTCGGSASNSVSGDEEYGSTNSGNCEDSINEENGAGDDDQEYEEGELPHQDLEDSDECMDQENGVKDGDNGEDGQECEEGELQHQDSEDSDECMNQENGEVFPVEDVKGDGVEISENHDEVSTPNDLVKRDEDVSSSEKVSVVDTEEKIFVESAKELNKNGEKPEISVKEDPKEIFDVDIAAVVVEEAEELNKNGEKSEIAVKDPKVISGAEKDEENAGDKEVQEPLI